MLKNFTLAAIITAASVAPDANAQVRIGVGGVQVGVGSPSYYYPGGYYGGYSTYSSPSYYYDSTMYSYPSTSYYYDPGTTYYTAPAVTTYSYPAYSYGYPAYGWGYGGTRYYSGYGNRGYWRGRWR